MTIMTLNAAQQAKPGPASATPLNLTTLFTSPGANTGVTFRNSGREVLYVQQGTATSTMAVTIGSTVEGQAVSSITYAGVASDIQMIGPFDSAFNDANGMVTVNLGTPANVTGVALVANAGSF